MRAGHRRSLVKKFLVRLRVKQVFRFGVFGLLAALIDFLVLSLAMALSWSPGVAKTLGYISALIFTLFLVARFTFRKKPSKTQRTKITFLYVATAVPNLIVFQGMYAAGLEIEASFVVALGVSSTLNFMGLKILLR